MTNNDVLLFFQKKLEEKKLNQNLSHLFLFLLTKVTNYSDIFLILNKKINFSEHKAKKLIKSYCEKNIPYQYFFCKCFFLDKTFYIKKKVFVPRPETEQLVVIVKKFLTYYPFFKAYPLIDLCSGTGVIGVSLANFFEEIFFVEKSFVARKCIKKNIKHLKNKKIKIFCNAFKFKKKITFLVSNPPYLKKNEDICNFSKNEPKNAFFYKSHENDFIIDFLEYATKNNLLNKKYFLIFEINFHNLEMFLKKLKNIDLKFYLIKDLENKTRFLIITSLNILPTILNQISF
ncbi:methyltransferase [symbiont of Argiope bruennichi]|uniref:methyltransferase n=1 Tax=symbiont of Argiope bruennichi TaxID=2810479 RepID=UPI003DA4C241